LKEGNLRLRYIKFKINNGNSNGSHYMCSNSVVSSLEARWWHFSSAHTGIPPSNFMYSRPKYFTISLQKKTSSFLKVMSGGSHSRTSDSELISNNWSKWASTMQGKSMQ